MQDLFCDITAQKCLALPGAGSPCLARACAKGNWCDTSGSAAGTCEAAKASGRACQNRDECQSGSCDSGVCAAPVVCAGP